MRIAQLLCGLAVALAPLSANAQSLATVERNGAFGQGCGSTVRVSAGEANTSPLPSALCVQPFASALPVMPGPGAASLSARSSEIVTRTMFGE